MIHTKCKAVIGLDCGRNTGIAIYATTNKRFIQLKTFEPHQFLLHLTTNKFFLRPIHELMFVVENANLNKVVFPAKFQNPAIRNLRGVQRDSAVAKIGMNVGRNLEATYITLNFLRERGYSLVEIKPTTIKWSQEILSEKFPYLTVSNEHTRDAVKLVAQYLNLDSDSLLF